MTSASRPARHAAGWPATAASCIRSCPPQALRDAAADLAAHPAGEHVCSNRTCEIGLQEITGQPYASFVLLLERLSR